MRTALIASLALALAGCGDPLFFAEIEERKICFELPAANVPAAPLSGLPAQTVESSGTFDLGSQVPGLDKKGTTGSIQLVSLSMVGSGNALQSIDSAEVDLPGADGQLTPFVSYARQPPTGALDCPAGGTSCTMAMQVAAASTDLFKEILANTGKLSYKISFTGSPPNQDWTVAIDFCMYVKVQVDALQAMKN